MIPQAVIFTVFSGFIGKKTSTILFCYKVLNRFLLVFTTMAAITRDKNRVNIDPSYHGIIFQMR